VTVIFVGASAGIWDFFRYRLVMRELSSIAAYTKVPFVSLLSVNSICLFIVFLVVGWLISQAPDYITLRDTVGGVGWFQTAGLAFRLSAWCATGAETSNLPHWED
jgi:hypothetical protein